MSMEEFYGLKEQPFSNSPDNRFYFKSHQHEEALVRLLHAVDTMKGLAVLVGEVGTGKTTLARRILADMEDGPYEAALLVIIHSDVGPEWLLRKVSAQLSVVDPSPDKHVLLGQLADRLAEIHETGRKAVILVDEANMLRSKDVMEEFRGLLNLEIPGAKLVTFVLFGLPELDTWLATDPALRQRTALRFTLHALNPTATREYIEHRLRIAGAQESIFVDEAYRVIYNYSKGIPRLVNTICDNALLEGYLVKKKVIEPAMIEDVVIGLGL